MIYRDREERAVRDGVFRFYKSVGPVAGGWKDGRREEGGGGRREEGGGAALAKASQGLGNSFFECYIFYTIPP